MARRRTLKLSPFNLTRRSTSGKVSRQLVPRGCTSDSVSANDSGCGVGHRAPEFQDDDIATTERESLPTLHEVAQKRAVESWKKIRLDMLKLNLRHYQRISFALLVQLIKLYIVVCNVAQEFFFAHSVMRLRIERRIYSIPEKFGR